MPRRAITTRLGKLLIEGRVLTQAQLDQALADAAARAGSLVEAIVRLGLASETQVTTTLTSRYGFPYLPLEHYEIDEHLREVVPESLARRYHLIPIDVVGNALTLAMTDPSDLEAIQAVELATKCVIQTCISTPSEVQQAIDRFYTHASGSNHPPSAER